MDIQHKGVVLIVSLMILLIMSLLAISSINSSRLDEKMASNAMDYKRAFQAAEMGLRYAETWLLNQHTEVIPSEIGENNIWLINAMDPDSNNAKSWWQERDRAWWINNAVSWPAMDGVRTGPYTIIEYKHYMRGDSSESRAIDGYLYYQITARGTGGSDNSVVILQSTVSRSY